LTRKVWEGEKSKKCFSMGDKGRAVFAIITNIITSIGLDLQLAVFPVPFHNFFKCKSELLKTKVAHQINPNSLIGLKMLKLQSGFILNKRKKEKKESIF